MPSEFSALELNILKAKGLSDAQLAYLAEIGVTKREDFSTVATIETLLELMPDLDHSIAARVMEWAGVTAAPVETPVAEKDELTEYSKSTYGGKVVLDTSDSVFCVHCGTKQPKDYSPGDLCPNCGRQAEPIETCYWCGSSGPGKYCRSCGATFVRTADLPLALMLRRDGLSKDDIPHKLADLSPSDRDALWGRVRRARG
jgi:hypothetical protein